MESRQLFEAELPGTSGRPSMPGWLRGLVYATEGPADVIEESGDKPRRPAGRLPSFEMLQEAQRRAAVAGVLKLAL